MIYAQGGLYRLMSQSIKMSFRPKVEKVKQTTWSSSELEVEENL